MSTAACDKTTKNVDNMVHVESPNVQYSEQYIESTIEYPINYALSEKDTIVVKIYFSNIILLFLNRMNCTKHYTINKKSRFIRCNYRYLNNHTLPSKKICIHITYHINIFFN